MRIIVLNGSPRPKGNTKQMVDAFRSGAESAGHRVDVIDVCRKSIPCWGRRICLSLPRRFIITVFQGS